MPRKQVTQGEKENRKERSNLMADIRASTIPLGSKSRL